jgi:hypothetical protein
MDEEKPHGGARKGAGRPPKNADEGRTKVVAASIPEGLVAQLDALAEQRGWNRSEAVTEAVRRLVRTRKTN